MRGPVFDLFCYVCGHMRHAIRVEDNHSSTFKLNMGVLISNPVSPIMWNIFFADLWISAHLEHSPCQPVLCLLLKQLHLGERLGAKKYGIWDVALGSNFPPN